MPDKIGFTGSGRVLARVAFYIREDFLLRELLTLAPYPDKKGSGDD